MMLSSRVLTTFLALSCIGVLAAHAQRASTCTYDFECGNVPYAFCNGGKDDCTDTINGIALSSDNRYIYYAQLCRTSEQYGNYTFKRIPVQGGVATNIYARQLIPAQGNPGSILGVVDNYLFFDTLLRQPGRGIKSVDLANPTAERDVSTNSLPQSGIEFDYVSNQPATYICAYNSGGLSGYFIERYPILPTSGQVSSSARLYNLPSSEACGPIKRFSDVDIFFTTTVYTYDYATQVSTETTKFYRGSITCSNCPPPAPFFTVAERVLDIDVSGPYVFFGTSTGLYRVNLDGTGKVKLTQQQEVVSGVEVVDNKAIYNNGRDIRAVDINGWNNVLLSWARIGNCACRPGFSGNDCSSCNGQVQWQPASQRPVCAALGANGVPASCFYDYQCPNSPYTACYSNKCACISANFTGSRCDQCDPPRKITWSEYGYPSCA